MKCSVVSYSLSQDPDTLSEWRRVLKEEISGFVEDGSEIILYPELFLMGLARYFEGDELKNVEDFISHELLPEISHLLNDKKVLLVLGSGPRSQDGSIYNSCPIFFENQWHFQDKLFLTPWETDFTPGSEVKLFAVNGLRTVVAVCFDTEQPDLALKLKESEIHLLLVPSATTNENGNNRVNRCSSARAIELGAAVLTSPLVGDSNCDLVDHSEGRQGFFLPAQEEVKCRQETFSAYSASEKVVSHYELDVEMLKKLKNHDSETKPYHKEFHSGLKLAKIK